MILESEYETALGQGKVFFTANYQNLTVNQSVELIVAADDQHDVYLTSSSVHTNVASGHFRTFLGDVADLSNAVAANVQHVNLKFFGQVPVGAAVYKSADIEAEQVVHDTPMIGLSSKQNPIPVDAGVDSVFAIVPAGKFMRINIENTDVTGDMKLTLGVVAIYNNSQ